MNTFDIKQYTHVPVFINPQMSANRMYNYADHQNKNKKRLNIFRVNNSLLGSCISLQFGEKYGILPTNIFQ